MTVPRELEAFLNGISNDFTDRTRMLVAADWCADHDPEYKSLEWFLRWLAAARGDHERGPIPMVLFTGSRRYGTPRPDSDFDWVVFTGAGQLLFAGAALANNADRSVVSGGRRFGTCGVDATFRFGPVNALFVTGLSQWDAWVTGTLALEARKPVTRDQAVAEFRAHRRARNLTETPTSGDAEEL